jgi:hypothetical protein
MRGHQINGGKILKIEIKSRWDSEKILFVGEGTTKEVLINAVKGGAYLGYADLGGAYLGGAYLGGADLRGADLRGAELRGADLRGAYLGYAYLGGADLRGAKNYSESHDFFIEIVRRQEVKAFGVELWGAIGQIVIHRLCWGTIKKRFGKKMLKVFRVLGKQGFDEYLKRYEEILKD